VILRGRPPQTKVPSANLYGFRILTSTCQNCLNHLKVVVEQHIETLITRVQARSVSQHVIGLNLSLQHLNRCHVYAIIVCTIMFGPLCVSIPYLAFHFHSVFIFSCCKALLYHMHHHDHNKPCIIFSVQLIKYYITLIRSFISTHSHVS